MVEINFEKHFRLHVSQTIFRSWERDFDPVQAAKKILSAAATPVKQTEHGRCSICQENRELFLDYGFPVCQPCIAYRGPSYY